MRCSRYGVAISLPHDRFKARLLGVHFHWCFLCSNSRVSLQALAELHTVCRLRDLPINSCGECRMPSLWIRYWHSLTGFEDQFLKSIHNLDVSDLPVPQDGIMQPCYQHTCVTYDTACTACKIKILGCVQVGSMSATRRAHSSIQGRLHTISKSPVDSADSGEKRATTTSQAHGLCHSLMAKSVRSRYLPDDCDAKS